MAIYSGYTLANTGGTIATESASTAYPAVDMFTTPGTPRHGMQCRLRILAAAAVTTGAGWYGTIQQSSDTTTWTNLIQSAPISPGSAGALGYYAEQNLPFVMNDQGRYLRWNSTLSTTLGGSSVTYAVEFTTGWPG